MGKKYHAKVKTGCGTCKKRRIKCDEAKPTCTNCSRSGRICGGYASVSTAAQLSWLHLVGPRSIVPAPGIGRRGREGRALAFFQHVAAPSFSYYPDRRFWVELVHAAALQDAAVRHAVIAIGSLVEKLRAGSSFFGNLILDRFALVHYNQALAHLVSRSADSTSMLLLCLLFICIESLSNNPRGAVEHCRYGITILNSVPVTPWVREHLAPLFIRQSIFPHFLALPLDSLPKIDYKPDFLPPYSTFDQCLVSLDLLTTRTCRFIRETDCYRVGDLYAVDFPPDIRLEHHYISTSVSEWLQDFLDFKLANPSASDETKCVYAYTHMKGLCAKVWFDSVLSKTEMGYDDDLSSFRQMIDCANEAISTMDPSGGALSPTFSFDLGYLPSLWVVAMRCRVLDVRLEALETMGKLSLTNEGLWQFAVFHAACKKAIELEHKIDLDSYDKEKYLEESPLVPPDEARIREIDFANSEIRVVPDEQGSFVMQMHVKFLYIEDRRLKVVPEWIKLCRVN
ncbi:hypothetical protein GQ53DRAFT_735959 [Thozetella sp. PMI_491]|nr:hypothetical protein GQ53DRAFT_735959 [Thozetella sp. PMI_491]